MKFRPNKLFFRKTLVLSWTKFLFCSTDNIAPPAIAQHRCPCWLTDLTSFWRWLQFVILIRRLSGLFSPCIPVGIRMLHTVDRRHAIGSCKWKWTGSQKTAHPSKKSAPFKTSLWPAQTQSFHESHKSFLFLCSLNLYFQSVSFHPSQQARRLIQDSCAYSLCMFSGSNSSREIAATIVSSEILYSPLKTQQS